MAARGGDKHPPSSSGSRALPATAPATPTPSYPPSRRSSGLTTRAHESDDEGEEVEQGVGHSSHSRRQGGRGLPSPRRLLEEEEEEKEEEAAEAEDEEEVATVVQEETQEESEEEGSDMEEHNGDSDDDSCATVPDEEWMEAGVDEVEAIADLRQQGLPIYFTCGQFKGVGLRALKHSPEGQDYLSEYLAKTPGWFQRCNVPQNMSLLESLSRLRMLRRVTDIKGRVVPTTRLIRDWKRKEERKNKVERKARATDRQRRRREWAAALVSTTGKGEEKIGSGGGGGGGGGEGQGAGLSSPAVVKWSALHTPLR